MCWKVHFGYNPIICNSFKLISCTNSSYVLAGQHEDRKGSAMLVQNSLTSQKGKKSSCSMLVQYNSLTIKVKS